MKSLKSKVILSALVLIFALVATIGSTFAWFTVSSTVSVSQLTLQVQTQESLLIKIADPLAIQSESTSHTVASEYSSLITETDILGWVRTSDSSLPYATINGSYLRPVTAIQPGYATVDGDQLRPLNSIEANPKRDLGTVLDINWDGTQGDIHSSSTGGVVQLKFWVLTLGAEASYDLSMSGIQAYTSTGTALAPGNNQDASNALRLSAYAGDFDPDGAGPLTNPTSLIYGPDVDYDFEFLTAQAGFFTGLETYTGTTLNGFNSLGELTAGYDGTEGNADDITDYTSLTGHGALGGAIITTLSPTFPKLVTVTFFLEGWDAEVTNDIMLAIFNISFSFTIA